MIMQYRRYWNLNRQLYEILIHKIHVQYLFLNYADKFGDSNYWCLLEEVIFAEHVAISRETFIGQPGTAIPTRETSCMPTSLENPQNIFVQNNFLASTAFWYRGCNI